MPLPRVRPRHCRMLSRRGSKARETIGKISAEPLNCPRNEQRSVISNSTCCCVEGDKARKHRGAGGIEGCARGKFMWGWSISTRSAFTPGAGGWAAMSSAKAALSEGRHHLWPPPRLSAEDGRGGVRRHLLGSCHGRAVPAGQGAKMNTNKH